MVDTALNDHTSKLFARTQIFIAIITVVSITSIILETVETLGRFHNLFEIIEWSTATVFGLEYLGRTITTKRKLKYIFSFWGLIDLASTAPTFLSFANLSVLKSARILRLIRLLRIFRLTRIAVAHMQDDKSEKTEADVARINAVIYFLALFSSIVAFGSALYIAEQSQPDYANIPLAMLQSAKIVLGGLGQTPALTMPGEIIILLSRLAGLALFGLLISVVGKGLNQLLFGDEKEKK